MDQYKRLLAAFALSVLIMAGAGAISLAGEAPGITVDGMRVASDAAPIIKEGRVLIPFRAAAEAIQVSVSWNSGSKTITASRGGVSVVMKIGSRRVTVNGNTQELDVPAVVQNGRTLVPVRFFSEAFSCSVQWDAANRVVKILSPRKKMSVVGFYALGDAKTSSWTDLFDRAYPEKGIGKTKQINRVEMGWYSMDGAGSLLTRSKTGWQRPTGWETVLEAAREYGLKADMVIHATDRDGDISVLLADPAAQEKLVEAVGAEAAAYDGVNIDFEGLGRTEQGADLLNVRNGFSAFIERLADRLKRDGKTLTVTLHPPNSSYRGYDYQALGEAADRIIVMAHDYGVKPEPEDRVAQAVLQAKQSVPDQKLWLGINVPNETAESILTKAGIAKRYNLQGISLWRLGVISDATWRNLDAAVEAVE